MSEYVKRLSSSNQGLGNNSHISEAAQNATELHTSAVQCGQFEASQKRSAGDTLRMSKCSVSVPNLTQKLKVSSGLMDAAN